MRFLESDQPVVAIVGPTGVGKTEISLQVAVRLGGEVISADSRGFYRGMDVGTAKPSPEDRARVRHHLVDILDPDEPYSLAQFQSAVDQSILAIHGRNKLPLLVGGTGQYVWSVVEGWTVPALAPDLRLRSAIESWAAEIGAESLYERLRRIDPEAARHIEPRNTRRSVRALEVIFRTGVRFSDQRQKSPPPYQWRVIGITRPRDEVFRRIDARVDWMMENGFEDEVRGLLARGFSPELPSLSAIGYREVAAVVRGELSRDDAAARIKSLTHQFVRRQANWFKPTDPRIRWFRAGPDTAVEIEAYIRQAEG